MPSPTASFEGLNFSGSCSGGQCGAGWPPDPVSDVGPSNYVEAVNTSIGIFDKSGAQKASVTFNALWGTSGTTPCTSGLNRGDPTVVYDPIADRWFVADFAFAVSGSGAPVGPFYECIAVSRTSDPVSGGWYLYPVQANASWLNDYAKMGIWPDGLYMSANMFDSTGAFREADIWAFNRADLESGVLVRNVVGTIPAAFTVLPATFHGPPPLAGTPEYLVSESTTQFAFEVRTMTVSWTPTSSGSISAPTNVSQQSYTSPGQNIVPQHGTTNLLDSLGDQLMMQAQYRDVAGAKSLWVSHSVQTSNGSPTGVQWAQIDVTGGAIATPPIQQQIWTNGADGLWRWLPSLAVDHRGDMAVGYSLSSAATYPSISYAGRLATDPLGQLSQGERSLRSGGGAQTHGCGTYPSCPRWGDYSAMTVDPADDCTFWYVNEYYPSVSAGSAGDWHTRIGAFQFPSCTVPTAPSMTTQPNPQAVANGQQATFTSTASGYPNPSVQWQVSADGGSSWSPVGGATSTTLTFTAHLSDNGHAYRAVFTNGSGSVTSNAATLTVSQPVGYWMVTLGGSVYSFGASQYHGGAPSSGTRGGVMHIEPTPTGNGYWILDAAGDVSVFGDAQNLGGIASLGPFEEATSMSATPTGQGYWIFTNFGRAFAFGDAPFLGDLSGVHLNGPVIGSVATPTGAGYYMVATDGGIFTFGDAVFHGSTGSIRLNAPVEGVVPTANNTGYWLVASDGGVFTFNAPFLGSLGSTRLNKPIVGMIHYGNGYLMVASDGGIFDFSDQPFLGSLGSTPPPSPVVSVASYGGK